jgi:hypothetical protein
MAVDFDAVRLIEKTILARVAAVGHRDIADAIHVDETTITNLKHPDRQKINFRSIATMLSVMGLKVVDRKNACYDPDKIQPIIDMAKEYMKTLDAKKLEFPE